MVVVCGAAHSRGVPGRNGGAEGGHRGLPRPLRHLARPWRTPPPTTIAVPTPFFLLALGGAQRWTRCALRCGGGGGGGIGQTNTLNTTTWLPVTSGSTLSLTNPTNASLAKRSAGARVRRVDIPADGTNTTRHYQVYAAADTLPIQCSPPPAPPPNGLYPDPKD
jgi:hypothetical protein